MSGKCVPVSRVGKVEGLTGRGGSGGGGDGGVHHGGVGRSHGASVIAAST